MRRSTEHPKHRGASTGRPDFGWFAIAGSQVTFLTEGEEADDGHILPGLPELGETLFCAVQLLRADGAGLALMGTADELRDVLARAIEAIDERHP